MSENRFFDSLVHPKSPEKKEPAMKWVDLIAFDQQQNKARVCVRCILVNGAVRFDGDAEVVAQLTSGIQTGPEERVLPSQGEVFLVALTREYRSPYLFASDLNEGDATAASKEILVDHEEMPKGE